MVSTVYTSKQLISYLHERVYAGMLEQQKVIAYTSTEVGGSFFRNPLVSQPASPSATVVYAVYTSKQLLYERVYTGMLHLHTVYCDNKPTRRLLSVSSSHIIKLFLSVCDNIFENPECEFVSVHFCSCKHFDTWRRL